MPRKSMHRTIDGRPKVPHKTEKLARKAMRVAIEQFGAYAPGINVYQCEECGLWHVGRKRNYGQSGRRRRVGRASTA